MNRFTSSNLKKSGRLTFALHFMSAMSSIASVLKKIFFDKCFWDVKVIRGKCYPQVNNKSKSIDIKQEEKKQTEFNYSEIIANIFQISRGFPTFSFKDFPVNFLNKHTRNAELYRYRTVEWSIKKLANLKHKWERGKQQVNSNKLLYTYRKTWIARISYTHSEQQLGKHV